MGAGGGGVEGIGAGCGGLQWCGGGTATGTAGGTGGRGGGAGQRRRGERIKPEEAGEHVPSFGTPRNCGAAVWAGPRDAERMPKVRRGCANEAAEDAACE